MSKQRPHVGLIGLAVMGENLALNIARNGFPLVVYNRTTLRTEEYLAGSAAGTGISGVATIPDLVAALEPPRQIILMVKAGVPVDAVLTELSPLLEPGDIVVDGGNSYFRDTERREVESSQAKSALRRYGRLRWRAWRALGPKPDARWSARGL